MSEVPTLVLSAVQKQLSTASLVRAVGNEAGYELYIMANSGTPAELETIDQEVRSVESSLRAAGTLKHPLHTVVTTW